MADMYGGARPKQVPCKENFDDSTGSNEVPSEATSVQSAVEPCCIEGPSNLKTLTSNSSERSVPQHSSTGHRLHSNSSDHSVPQYSSTSPRLHSNTDNTLPNERPCEAAVKNTNTGVSSFKNEERICSSSKEDVDASCKSDGASNNEYDFIFEPELGEIVRRPMDEQEKKDQPNSTQSKPFSQNTAQVLSKLKYALPYLPEHLRNQLRQYEETERIWHENEEQSDLVENDSNENRTKCMIDGLPDWDGQREAYLQLQCDSDGSKTTSSWQNHKTDEFDEEENWPLRRAMRKQSLDAVSLDEEELKMEASLEDPFHVRGKETMSLCTGIMDMMDRLPPSSLSPKQKIDKEQTKGDNAKSKFWFDDSIWKNGDSDNEDNVYPYSVDSKDYGTCAICKMPEPDHGTCCSRVKCRDSGTVHPAASEDADDDFSLCDTEARTCLCCYDDCDICCSENSRVPSGVGSVRASTVRNNLTSVRQCPRDDNTARGISTDWSKRKKLQERKPDTKCSVCNMNRQSSKPSQRNNCDILDGLCSKIHRSSRTNDLSSVHVNDRYECDCDENEELGFRLFSSQSLCPYCYGEQCGVDSNKNARECVQYRSRARTPFHRRETSPFAISRERSMFQSPSSRDSPTDLQDEDLLLPRLLPDDLYHSRSRSSFDLDEVLSGSSYNASRASTDRVSDSGLDDLSLEANVLDDYHGYGADLTQQDTDLALRSVTDPYMDHWNWNLGYGDTDLIGDPANFGFPMELASFVVNGIDTLLVDVLQVNFMLTFLIQRMPELMSDLSGVPTPQSVIDQLPLVDMDDTLLEQHPSCPICLASTQQGDEMSQLPCQHIFHPVCVRAWLNKSATCPVCRQSVAVL